MSRPHQTSQQHVFMPKSHKAFSKLWPHIIEISYLWEGGVLTTEVLRAAEEMRDVCMQVCQGRKALPWLYPGLLLRRAKHCGQEKSTTESSSLEG